MSRRPLSHCKERRGDSTALLTATRGEELRHGQVTSLTARCVLPQKTPATIPSAVAVTSLQVYLVRENQSSVEFTVGVSPLSVLTAEAIAYHS